MEKRDEPPGPFNERAALEELERFKDDIERYRQQRKAVGDEFDQFVKTLKARDAAAPPPRQDAVRADEGPKREAPRVESRPLSPPPVEPLRPEVPRVEPARTQAASAARATEGSVQHSAPSAAVARPAVPKTREGTPAQATPAALPPTREQLGHRAPAPKTGSTPSTVVVIALLLLAAGIAVWFFWPKNVGESPTETAAQSAPAPVTQPAKPTAPPPQAPPAAAAPVDETVLTTTRLAWVRLIVDGKQIFERELPAGTRHPFTAGKTVVIRTGDAGAVSLTLKGKPLGPLGAEGQVVTRSFTVEQ